jgi:hypothetical protein
MAICKMGSAVSSDVSFVDHHVMDDERCVCFVYEIERKMKGRLSGYRRRKSKTARKMWK